MRYSTLLIFLLPFFSSSAQVAVKVYGFSPTSSLGAIMSKTVAFEISKLANHSDNEFRLRLGIGYMSMQPRLDTFYKAAKTSGSNGTTFTSGYDSYDWFHNIYVFSGYDYIKENDRRFKIYPGIDITAGGYSYKMRTKFYNFISDDKIYEMYGGVRLRGGLLYEVSDKINLNLEVGTVFNLLYSADYFWCGNEIGLNVQFLLNNE